MYKILWAACSLLFASAVVAEPTNLALLTHEVKTYHDSGAYKRELSEVIHAAQDYIVARAKENLHVKHPQKLAIVLDIDETSLSNYDKMAKRQFVATREALHREILKADAPAIEPTLTLYQEAKKQGIAVFFVTGRYESQRAATKQNLFKAGYQHWEGLYLKPDHYHLKSIIPFKAKARAAIAKQGYTIIASIGDQLSDLTGGYAEKTFKLPNPYYYLP